MMSPISTEEIIATLLRYYPPGIDVHADPDAYEATEENRRLVALCDARLADQSAWKAALDAIKVSCPGWTFWDRTIPGRPCHEVQMHAPGSGPGGYTAIVALVSFIAPVYYIHVQTWSPDGGQRGLHGAEAPLAEERRRIAEILEQQLGVGSVPTSWTDVEVPGLLSDWAGRGGIAIRDLLFDSGLD